MDVKTYPAMNELIKDLLRHSEEPMNLYILARIEELERTVSDLTPPPNDPLTLEELREMDGEPVWVVQPGYKPGWALVRVTWTVTMLIFNDGKMVAAEFAMLEEGCKIYRRKPEEGMT